MALSAGEFVRRMARIGYPPLFSKPRYLALIQAFCDESSDSEQEVFTVAGLLAEEDEWVVLSEEWKDRLSADGLKHYHATDCAGGYNDFRNMSQDARITLNKDLVTLMTKRRLAGFAVSVSYKDFRDLIENVDGADKVLNTHPYFIASQLLILRICNEIAREHPTEYGLAFYFEENESVSGQAKQIYDDLRRKNTDIAKHMGSLVYVGKRRMIPLQVADELAFEAMKNAQGYVKNKPDRIPIKRMFEAKILCSLEYLDRVGMENFIASNRPENGQSLRINGGGVYAE